MTEARWQDQATIRLRALDKRIASNSRKRLFSWIDHTSHQMDVREACDLRAALTKSYANSDTPVACAMRAATA